MDATPRLLVRAVAGKDHKLPAPESNAVFVRVRLTLKCALQRHNQGQQQGEKESESWKPWFPGSVCAGFDRLRNGFSYGLQLDWRFPQVGSLRLVALSGYGTRQSQGINYRKLR